MKKIKIIFLSFSMVFFLVLTIDNVKADDNLEKQIQTGWQEIADSKYYFDETGTMAKGVYEIAGEKYLFGVNTGKLYTNGLATTPDGKTYLTNSEGKLVTGFQTIDNKKYYFGQDGVMSKGIQEIEGSRYYFDNKTGILHTDELLEIDNNKYYATSDGKFYIGFKTIKDDKYYFDATGTMVKGVYEISGEKYLFGVNTGKLYTNGLATTPDGKTYLTNSEGKVVTGFQNFNGHKYYFNQDGVMSKGIQEIEGSRYYFDSKTGVLHTDELLELDNNKYYATSDGKFYIGFKTIKDDKYYFDATGTMVKGVYEISGEKYLFGVNTGKLYTNGLATTPDGKTYLTNSEGKVVTGFQTIDNKKYYFGQDGAMTKGIQEIEGSRYYFDGKTGILHTDELLELDNNKYYATSDGKFYIGFKTIKGAKYYFDETGTMVKGVYEISGEKYLFGVNTGKLYTDGFATTPDGNTYYTDTTGKLHNGWLTLKNDKYYFDQEGIMKTGLTLIDNEKYLFNSKGKMLIGIQEMNGHKYLFGVLTGKLYYGFATTPDGNTYYSNQEGILLNGLQKINGNIYLFGINSYKLYYGWATTPDGNKYYSNQEGIIQTGNQKIDGNWYHFDETGKLENGWQEFEGKKYYFFADGTKALGMQKIEGKRYLFNNKGEMLKENVQLWIDVSYAQGDIDWDSLWQSGEIDGVIIRIGSGAYVEDSRLARNIAAVKRLNIPYTTYYFSYAENKEEALQEAKNMINLYKKYGINSQLPSYYDIEYFSYMFKEQYQEIIETYSQYAASNGVSIKVYANKNFSENLFNEETRKYVDWIAHYTGENIGSTSAENIYSDKPRYLTNYFGSWRMWQYCNSGSVTGIKGRVDLNLVLY